MDRSLQPNIHDDWASALDRWETAIRKTQGVPTFAFGDADRLLWHRLVQSAPNPGNKQAICVETLASLPDLTHLSRYAVRKSFLAFQAIGMVTREKLAPYRYKPICLIAPPQTTPSAPPPSTWNDTVGLDLCIAELRQICTSHPDLNDERRLRNIKCFLVETVNEIHVAAEGGLARVLDVLQRLRRDNSHGGERERRSLRNSPYLGPELSTNLTKNFWLRQYPGFTATTTQTTASAPRSSTWNDTDGLDLCIAELKQICTSHPEVNDEVQLQNIKHLIWDTAVNEPRVVAEGGLPRVLDVMQRLRCDNSQVGEGERQYLRDSTYLGPNVCKNLKDWMRQYPVQPRNLHEGESASQQPSYPTDHEVLLWRDGVLAELNWAEGGHYYCDRPTCDDCD
jgi:hypothetical protein